MKILNSLRRGAERRKSQSGNPRRQRLGAEALERRAMLSAGPFISEVHPSGSGNLTYAADWFEVTNPGPAALDVTGWKMDDNSNASGSAVPLRGVTSIPAGRSVVFFDDTTSGATAGPDPTVLANFSTAWFGSATPPPGVLIGAYGGAGVGLGAGGDAVNLFDAGGNRVT